MILPRTPHVLGLVLAFVAAGTRAHGAPLQAGPERREPAAPADLDATKLYPPERNTALLTFFSIEGKLDPEPLRKALAELGTKDVEARIVYGPESTAARPGRFFLAVEAPASVKPKELVLALKKGAAVVEHQSATCFKGPVRDLPDTGPGKMAGMTARDWVLGISNDLRWVDTSAGWHQFFATPGKLDAATIADRFEKTFAPFGVRTVGTLVREGFTWSLAGPCEPAVAKKLEKALQKLPGVALARLDGAAHTLTVQFDLEGLLVSGPAVPESMLAEASGRKPAPEAPEASGPGAGRATRAPRVRFDVNPILDLLEKEHVGVVHPAAPDAPEPEAPPRGG